MVRARIMEVMAGPGSVWGTTSPWHGITILSSFPPCCHCHHSPGLTSSLIPYHMHTPCIAHGTLAPIASTCPQAFHSPCCALLPCPPASTSPPPTFHALSLFPCHSQASAALEVAQLTWNGTVQRVVAEITAGPPRGGERVKDGRSEEGGQQHP